MTACALDAISVPAFIISREHKVLAWNSACELLTGLKADEVIGTDRHWTPFYATARPCLADLVVDNAFDRLQDLYGQAGKAQFAFDAYKAEGWYDDLNGKRRYLTFEARPLVADGQVTGALQMLQDITEYKEANDKLRLAASVFDNTSEGIMITDANNKLISVNKAFQAITGYGEEVLGKDPRMLASDRHSNDFYRDMWVNLRRCGTWQGEVWNRRKSGEEYVARMYISVVLDSDKVANYVGMFTDITKGKEAEDRINFMVHHDFLTGLPNRVLLEDRISQLIARAGRGGEGFAVAFLDLDRFKLVNDALGHDIGDKLLKEVAARLQNSVRATDTVSRQGGDEFVLLLTGMDNPNDIAQVVSKLVGALGMPYLVKGHQLVVTPSIGLSVFPADGNSPAELIQHADTAMYHAKQSGRNNFQFFTPGLNAQAFDALMIANGLKSAIPSELFLEYQPQLSLTSRDLFGSEALVRWSHPTRGLISPAKFVPLAEDNGLIRDIGRWVLQKSCQLIRTTELKIAVNLSPVQLLEDDLIAQVEEALDGLDPGLLTLELTEGAFIHDFHKTRGILGKLKELGVTLALDDFGTGYSSLSYLRQLPFDYLKIDQSFIQDESARPIVIAIIGLAEKLGMATIAEGVETPEQACFLERHGCSAIQGFYFSRPLGEPAFLEFSARQPKGRGVQPAPPSMREPHLSWSFTFETGIPVIDRQHRNLIDIINYLHDNIEDETVVKATLDELSAYARYHFQQEAELMSRFHLEDTANHLGEHGAFTARLSALMGQFAANSSPSLAAETAVFLRDWLTDHILKIDKELGRSLLLAGFTE